MSGRHTGCLSVCCFQTSGKLRGTLRLASVGCERSLFHPPARLFLSLPSTLSSRAKQIVRKADDAKSRDLLFAALTGKQVPPRARRFARRIIPARLSLSLPSTLSSRAKQIVREADDAKSRDLLFAALTESRSLRAPDDSQGESSGLVGMTELCVIVLDAENQVLAQTLKIKVPYRSTITSPLSILIV